MSAGASEIGRMIPIIDRLSRRYGATLGRPRHLSRLPQSGIGEALFGPATALAVNPDPEFVGSHIGVGFRGFKVA